MKILKHIQENGMVFGMADAVKRDLTSRNVSLHDLIRGLTLAKAKKVLAKRGISEDQINLILNAKEVSLQEGSFTRQWIDTRKMDILSVDIVLDLIKKGLVFQSKPGGEFYLSKDGLTLWDTLRHCNKPSVEIKKDVAYYLDIDLSRDGLITTCKKIGWLLKNNTEVKAYREQLFLENLAADQKLLDNTLNLIATSEQRVARQLIEQGPTVVARNWTEEQQRAQNDLYWLTDSLSAFWLNPHGMLAEPTPAPDWWSPPLNYQSAVQHHLEKIKENDVVGNSLLPPKEHQKAISLNEVIEELESLVHKEAKNKKYKNEKYSYYTASADSGKNEVYLYTASTK
jgi:hypothetical protein